MKEACAKFLLEEPEMESVSADTRPKPQTQRVRMKRKTTYRELKSEIDALALPDSAEIELELEG